MSFLYKYRKLILLVLIAAGGVLAAVAAVYNTHPYADVAERYAPMAEAFVRGDWRYSFHPRIQPLLPVSGGIVAFLTGCDGFTALKTVSLLWHFASAVLLFFLLRDIYRKNDLVPWGATAFYMWFPYTLHVAISGFRDGAKVFALILAAWGLIRIMRDCRRLPGHIMLGTSCLLQVLTRADTIMTACAFAFAAVVIECREKRYPAYSFVPVSFTALGITGNSLINFFISGAAMPDFRFAMFFFKYFQRMAGIGDIVVITAILILVIVLTAWFTAYLIRWCGIKPLFWLLLILPVVSSVWSGIKAPPEAVPHFISELLKGFYHFAGLFILLTIAVLAWRKKLKPEEFILLLTVIFNAVLNILPIQIFHNELYVASRYLYTALPLLFGFFVIGVQGVYTFVRRYLPGVYCDIILVLCCAGIMTGFTIHALQPLVRSYTRDARKSIDEISRIIREDYPGGKFCDPEIRMGWYRSRQLPKILFFMKTKVTVSAYLAGGSMATWYQESDYMITGKPEPPKMAVKLLKKISFPGEPEYYIWKVTSKSRKY